MPVTLHDLSNELGNTSLIEASTRISNRITEFENTQKHISSGRGFMAESESRRKEYDIRQISILEEDAVLSKLNTQAVSKTKLSTTEEATPLQERLTSSELTELIQERKIGTTNDIVSIEFLEYGLLAAKSVGRVNVSTGTELGTGFLVGNQIIMTNHHVVPNEDIAADTMFELNVEDNRIGPVKRPYEYALNPDRFFLTNEALDFTLVAVTDFVGGNPALESFGWHILLKQQGKIRKGDPVNIIQHPDGKQKKIVVHNSHLLHIENETVYEHYCWYSGDTEKGSSGSPVFNNRWEVIALHHQAVPKTNDNDEVLSIDDETMTKEDVVKYPEKVAWVANEGVRASRIVSAIESATDEDLKSSDDMKKIRDDLIALWRTRGAHRRGQNSAAGGN